MIGLLINDEMEMIWDGFTVLMNKKQKSQKPQTANMPGQIQTAYLQKTNRETFRYTKPIGVTRNKKQQVSPQIIPTLLHQGMRLQTDILVV
jgi:hypothetical protein